MLACRIILLTFGDVLKDWKTARIYVLDIEGSRGSGVLEFGIVGLFNGAVFETRTETCQPLGPIESRDYAVHRLRSDELAGQQPFADHFGAFVDYRRSGLFAAHNRHAEQGFLKQTWAVPSLVPDPVRPGEWLQEWGPWIDTLSLYRQIYKGLAGYGLMELVETFALSDRVNDLAQLHCPPARRRPHCALYDALASALLLLRLEEEAELANRITLNWLLQLSMNWSVQEEFPL